MTKTARELASMLANLMPEAFAGPVSQAEGDPMPFHLDRDFSEHERERYLKTAEALLTHLEAVGALDE